MAAERDTELSKQRTRHNNYCGKDGLRSLCTMAGGHHGRRPSLALPCAWGVIGSADRKRAERRLTTR